MRDRGKHYYSVIDDLLFPINDLGCVVPASLHISLGITLLLQNSLLNVCRTLDSPDGVATLSPEKQELENNHELDSLVVDRLQRTVTALSVDIITMMNRLECFHAVMEGNHNKNNTIASMGSG